MLIALLNGQRLAASAAIKAESYVCPGCKSKVILHKGRIRIAHFAHERGAKCSWGKGETIEHRTAKLKLAESMRNRGLRAEEEFVVESLVGDRRADVMTWNASGKAIAVELQHTPILLPDIERRARSYAREGIAQIWIPFIRPLVWEKALYVGEGFWEVEKYPVRPFEKWIRGCNKDSLFWMYDPKTELYWHAMLHDFLIHVEEGERYEDGDVIPTGGYSYTSAKWMTLMLWGDTKAEGLRLLPKKPLAERWTKEFSMRWPAGRYADFTPAGPYIPQSGATGP